MNAFAFDQREAAPHIHNRYIPQLASACTKTHEMAPLK